MEGEACDEAVVLRSAGDDVAVLDGPDEDVALLAGGGEVETVDGEGKSRDTLCKGRSSTVSRVEGEQEAYAVVTILRSERASFLPRVPTDDRDVCRKIVVRKRSRTREERETHRCPCSKRRRTCSTDAK